MRTLARCPSKQQAEVIASHYDVTAPEDMEFFGEERCIVRVLPIGGEWHVQSWPKSALMWEAEDEADVPWTSDDLEGDVDVSFP